jgi:hypothetical protein
MNKGGILKIKMLTTAVLLFLSTACAHSHPVEGPEKQSEIPEGIRVAMGGSELKEGERINVTKSECTKEFRGRQGNVKKCISKKIGEATVIKILDHDSAIVKPDDGVAMDKDTRVEKQ